MIEPDKVQTLATGEQFVWTYDKDRSVWIMLNRSFTGIVELHWYSDQYVLKARVDWWPAPGTETGTDDLQKAKEIAQITYMMLTANDLKDNRDKALDATKIALTLTHGVTND